MARSPEPSSQSALRMAEVLAAFSLATDLGMIQPMGHVLRACYIAMCIAQELRLSTPEQTVLYYATLLMHSGCTASSSALAALFATDEQEIGRELHLVDPNNPLAMLGWMVRNIAPDLPFPARVSHMLQAMTQASQVKTDGQRATCEVGARMARRLGMPVEVQETLRNLYERWDGKGFNKLAGDAIPIAARIVDPASMIEVYSTSRGPRQAEEYAHRESGASLDPNVAAAFLSVAKRATFWEALRREDLKDTVLDLEPDNPLRRLDEQNFEAVVLAFADFADIKSTATLSHSKGTAQYAEAVAIHLGLAQTDVDQIRRAALLHDLGHVAVGSHILDKRAPLTEAERERLRLHPYYSERILATVPALRPLAVLAGAHHEWINGQGYYRGLSGKDIPLGAQIIAMADAFHEALEDPDSPARREPANALKALQPAVGSQFSPQCFEALAQLFGVKGSPARRQRARPAGLTDREIEVLRLVAKGLTNKQIARQLVLSKKTVGHHLEHIYNKLDVSTRAATVFFALEHDLLS